MDTSTGAECREITKSLGSSEEICRRSGSIAIERFTGPQIRRFSKLDADAYARTARIHLVSSFIASVLAGKSVSIDFGDGAGMNLLNLAQAGWDKDLLDATAPGLGNKLTSPAAATTIQGPISSYFVNKYGFSSSCRCALFTGDNPASLVGMGATAPGNIVISLGTSDTFFASMPGPKTDPNGYGHVFGNPMGGFMSLICFRNGSLSREALRDQVGADWSAFDAPALATTASAAGQNLMLPFFGPEITPRHDFSAPVRKGSAEFEAGNNSGLQIRALLEGQFLNMRLHSQWMGVKAERIRLTGGASKNNGIAQLVADIFQAPVERLEVSNSAALGGALIAAAAAGHDITSLQATFCQASQGSTLMPNPALGPVYDKAILAYENLLATAMA
jgi:xylulokinase